ncbi:hypothetical protein ACJMK2_033802, partial [Sinanodonta woodiana]
QQLAQKCAVCSNCPWGKQFSHTSRTDPTRLTTPQNDMINNRVTLRRHELPALK